MLVDAEAGYNIGEILVDNKPQYAELPVALEMIYLGHMSRKM